MRSNHQEEDNGKINNIKAPHQMHEIQSINTSTQLHQTNNNTTRSARPNYKHTILQRHRVICRLKQLNSSTIQLQNKLKQRTTQLHHQMSLHTPLEWYGDKMNFNDRWETGEYTKTIRICSINVNGISQDLDWIEWDMILRSMHKLQIDILGITEPNINFKNKHTVNKIYDTAKAFEKNMQISLSCSNQLIKSTKKKGGTMTILSGRWAGRKKNHAADQKGRWSSTTLVGKKGRHVTLITAYRVCQQKGGVGCTIYHQQQLDFEEEGKRMLNLRKQFCSDMVMTVRDLHLKGHIVILMGDFNEDLNIQGNQINTMLRDCGLTNVITYVHGTKDPLPPTYDRGKKCLDTIAISDSENIPKSSITRAGFLPFYHECCLDHRAVYCDIDTNALFDNISHERTNSSTRPFTTNNIKQCEKFKSILRASYKKSKIFENINILEKKFKSRDINERKLAISECIKYGNIASQLMLDAGRKTSKTKYTNGRPFSDQLNKTARKYHMAKNKLRYLQQKQGNNLNDKTKTQLVENIKKLYRELRSVQRDAKKIREKFLMEIAEKRASEWRLSSNSALTVILQSEASKRTYARHGKVMKNEEKGAISSLMVPVPQYRNNIKETEEVGWTEIEDDETIHSLLLKKNAQQLMRSAKSPFATGPITDACGFDGEKATTEKIIGNLLSSSERIRLTRGHNDVKHELDEFIIALGQPTDIHGNTIHDFKWQFGMKEFRKTFRKTRESTACGPSGLNMSYWKACTEDDDIATAQAFFIEKAFQFGFSYPRWKTSWHCMLKKDKKPFLHRLRIIQLFEGDFNGALKYLLGRLLMYHIVKTRQCTPQAFGSIPGRTAHEALLTLQLVYDNARITKQPTASLFNDAAGCYDRIRPLLSHLSMLRVGCPNGISYCHSITQREMNHYVKTSRGVSKGNIRWSSAISTSESMENGITTISGNIGGIGQGGGGSPVGWLAVLIVMIQTYSKFVTGVQMTDPLQLYTLTLFLISYVDDNTLVQRFKQEQTMESILSHLQYCLKRWHNILRITGGDLALAKCTFSLMKWKWKGIEPILETEISAPGQITINGTPIKRLEPNQGTRVLGVRMAMDGSFTDELKYRIQQSKSMGTKLYNSWLSATDSYMVYETRYRPAMEYPLMITTFSKSQLEKIQKPFVHLLLPKIGLNRHTPLAVVHGPIFRGGLGIVRLEEQQIIKHFSSFQGHLRRDDNIALSLRIQLMLQQLEVGSGKLFLNTDPSKYPYATHNTRLGYLWRQCFRFSIQVNLHHQWEPSCSDGTTDTIMDHLIDLFPANKKRNRLLYRLNACRLYLRLLWVSDLLLTPSSTLMDTDIINGNKICHTTNLQYPFQAKPSKADFSLWKDCIHRCFCKYITPVNSTKAEIHIAQRVISPPRFNIESIYSDYTDILRSLQNNFSLEEKFNNLPRRFRDIIGDIELPYDDGESIIKALKEGTALSASDGSYLEDSKRGSHAYKIIASDKDEGYIQGGNISPSSDKMSSSPTEHYGAISILVILIVLLYHHSEDGYGWPVLTLYIDNEEVVNRGSTNNPSFMNIGQYLVHDFDLWMVISHLQSRLALKIEFEWIKGHQIPTENTKNGTGILLNIDVDKLATAQYNKQTAIPQRGSFLAGIVCYHQNGNHVQDIYNAITSRETDNDLIEYYISKGWKLDVLERVDWIAMEKFLKRRHPIERCKIVQTMHDWQNTGYQKQQFSQSHDNEKTINTETTCSMNSINHAECPLQCGCIETPFHYMQCNSKILSDARVLGIEKLEKSLYKMRTSPPLQEAIIYGILCWETMTEFELNDKSHPQLFDLSHTQLIQVQSEIGWDKFIKGFITKEWGAMQGKFYRSQKSTSHRKFTRNAWTHNLLLQLHIYRHRIWMVRNETLHGGVTQEQKSVSRISMIKEVKVLYKKNRRRIPARERSLFHLPLRFRIKQGQQQLQLWIKRAKLMFSAYEDIHISNDQTNRITNWLSNWDLGETTIANAATRSDLPVQRSRVESFDSETSAPRLGAEQINITNWLKSWGQHSTTTKIHDKTEIPVPSQVSNN